MILFPFFAIGEEINVEGWPIPNLKGLHPYSISVKRVDGVEKVVEKFYTPNGGHIARISGNGKVFAYAVDHDQEPPIDYLILDIDGSGRFIKKLGPNESYTIPEWVSD
jgi:hypothetical protein